MYDCPNNPLRADRLLTSRTDDLYIAGLIAGRVVYVSNNTLLIVRDNRLFGSEDYGATWKRFGAVPLNYSNRVLSFNTLLRRFSRRGVHHCVKVDSEYFLIANGSVYAISTSGVVRLDSVRGNRPLVVQGNEQGVHYGEYRSNPERSPVAVWKLTHAGKETTPVAWFNGVRHIHGVFHDPHEGNWWVTTGDHDEEAGIWKTNDEFLTVQRVVGGSQRYRAVQLLFAQSHIYFGSDAPNEQNHIYRMDRQGRKVEQLQQVGGPVFYGCKVGASLFFSTAVEPSSVNKTRYAEVWRSDDGSSWRRILRFRKDILPMKWFQYGQVLFPSGEGDGQHLYCTPFATEMHGRTLVVTL